MQNTSKIWRSLILYRVAKVYGFCLKQGQGLKASTAHCHPNFLKVPPPAEQSKYRMCGRVNWTDLLDLVYCKSERDLFSQPIRKICLINHQTIKENCLLTESGRSLYSWPIWQRRLFFSMWRSASERRFKLTSHLTWNEICLLGQSEIIE